MAIDWQDSIEGSDATLLPACSFFAGERRSHQENNEVAKKKLPFELSVHDLNRFQNGTPAEQNVLCLLTENHSDNIAIKEHRLRRLCPVLIQYLTKAELKAYQEELKALVELKIIDFNDALIREQSSAKDKLDGLLFELARLKHLTIELSARELSGESATLDEKAWSSVRRFLQLNREEAVLSWGQRIWRYLWGAKGKGEGEEILDELMINPMHLALERMNDSNDLRLYSIWALGNGGFLDSLNIPEVRKLIPWVDWDRFSRRLNTPNTQLGELSFGLYTVRFIGHSTLWLKHKYFPNEKEKILASEARDKQQKAQRKYVMWNDLVWGIINWSCFVQFTARKSPLMAAIGGFLNVFLMVFDYAMIHKQRIETARDNNKAMSGLEEEIKALRQRLDVIKKRISNAQEEDSLETQKIERLLAAKREELDLWQEKNEKDMGHYTRLHYTTIGFTLGMALMYAPDFAKILGLSTVGSAAWLMAGGGFICTALTIIEVAGNHLDEINLLKKRCVKVREELKAFAAMNPLANDREQTRNLLERKRLNSELDYYQDKIKDEECLLGIKVALLSLAPVALFMILNVGSCGVMFGLMAAMAVSALMLRYTLEPMLRTAKEPSPLDLKLEGELQVNASAPVCN